MGCEIEHAVHVLRKTRVALCAISFFVTSKYYLKYELYKYMIETVADPCAPREPQFEHVVPAAALDGLVSGVEARVVVLVTLEQVTRA